jgi:parallel beta-helix repeat protein
MLSIRESSNYLALLLVFGLPLTAATWCVNPTGSGGCTKTIGAAVTGASAGDTVTVAPGTYPEVVMIDKPLVLAGGDPATTIIDATGLPNGIWVNGMESPNVTASAPSGLSGVVVSGFTVKNAKFEGILVTNASAVTISGNVVTGSNTGLTIAGGMPTCPGAPAWETAEDFDCGEAIHLAGVDHSSVLNNTVQGNAGGILLTDETGATHDNLISGNVVADNPFDCGITLASHPPAMTAVGAKGPLGVYANTVTGNQSLRNGPKGEGAGVGIFAAPPGGAAYNNVVADNVLTGNGIPGVAIHGHAPGQNLDGNIIVGNTLSGNGADVADTATPGSAGIAITSVGPVAGTVVAQNSIDHEMIGVAWNAAGEAHINGNSFVGLNYGVYNLGPGTINAEGNFWGCLGGPTGPAAHFAGCSIAGGAVTVNSWLPAAVGAKK